MKGISMKVLGVGLGLLFCATGAVNAQAVGELEVASSGLTAIAELSRSTPCSPYTLAWGDGSEDMIETAAEVCIQVIDEVTLAHTYEEAGEYTIELTVSDGTYTESVTIAESDFSFGLNDVATITEEWVDPSPLMADEEYSVYTITLKNGETAHVKAGGFTLKEWHHEQFRNAGYTGDMDELLAMVDQDEPVEPEPADPGPIDPVVSNETLIERLVAALRELINRLSAR